MRIPIQSVADLGLAVRAVRRHSRVRIDDLAATARVSIIRIEISVRFMVFILLLFSY